MRDLPQVLSGAASSLPAEMLRERGQRLLN